MLIISSNSSKIVWGANYWNWTDSHSTRDIKSKQFADVWEIVDKTSPDLHAKESEITQKLDILLKEKYLCQDKLTQSMVLVYLSILEQKDEFLKDVIQAAKSRGLTWTMGWQDNNEPSICIGNLEIRLDESEVGKKWAEVEAMADPELKAAVDRVAAKIAPLIYEDSKIREELALRRTRLYEECTKKIKELQTLANDEDKFPRMINEWYVIDHDLFKSHVIHFATHGVWPEDK